MPNSISHKIYAEDVAALSSDGVAAIIKKAPQAYILGAQGGDFLFALRELGFKQGNLGSTFHTLYNFEIFSSFGNYTKEKASPVLLSYMLGLTCHYAFDRTVHPYVYYMLEEEFPKYLPAEYQPCIHTLIESAFDCYLCESKRNISPNLYPAGDAARASKAVRMEIGEMYARFVPSLFDVPLSAKNVSLAFFITCKFLSFTSDKSGKRKVLAEKLEALLKKGKSASALFRPPFGYGEIDYLNEKRTPWTVVRYREELSTETFSELYERSVAYGVKRVADFFSFLTGSEALSKSDYDVTYDGTVAD